MLSLAMLPLLMPAPEATALALPSLPSLPVFGGAAPRITELSTPSICQARLRDQDFVAITYVSQRPALEPRVSAAAGSR